MNDTLRFLIEIIGTAIKKEVFIIILVFLVLSIPISIDYYMSTHTEHIIGKVVDVEYERRLIFQPIPLGKNVIVMPTEETYTIVKLDNGKIFEIEGEHKFKIGGIYDFTVFDNSIREYRKISETSSNP